MVKSQDESSFQPKIAYKTRYGIVANPFADELGAIGSGAANHGIGSAGTNPYFRRLVVAGV